MARANRKKEPKMSVYQIKIQITDSQGRRLSVEKRPDARMLFEFDMIDDALDFLTNYLGATGYRVNDDGEFESHVVESFTATEYGLDVTAQIDDCLSML